MLFHLRDAFRALGACRAGPHRPNLPAVQSFFREAVAEAAPHLVLPARRRPGRPAGGERLEQRRGLNRLAQGHTGLGSTYGRTRG